VCSFLTEHAQLFGNHQSVQSARSVITNQENWRNFWPTPFVEQLLQTTVATAAAAAAAPDDAHLMHTLDTYSHPALTQYCRQCGTAAQWVVSTHCKPTTTYGGPPTENA
jgi:hypothetical protein